MSNLGRARSVRLIAVVGGLGMNLAFLFASFGHKLHQIFISYGLLFGLCCCAVRESASLMVGQYFKERRDLAEVWVGSGAGLGILTFSLLYSKAIGELKWRLGLQAIQAVVVFSFFLGLFYRPASLYHPQRDAISHIKCQKEKVKGVNPKEKQKTKRRSQLTDLSFLREWRVRWLAAGLAVAAAGLYTPAFYLVHHAWRERDRAVTAELSVVQLWLGLSTTAGSLLAGVTTIPSSLQFFISYRLLLQTSLAVAALATFALYCVEGYHAYLLCGSLYGLALGCAMQASKLLCYSSIRPREFAQAWSFLQAGQALPSLAGTLLTGYINGDQGKTGYWVSLVALGVGCGLLSQVGEEQPRPPAPPPAPVPPHLNGDVMVGEQLLAGRKLCYSDPALLATTEPGPQQVREDRRLVVDQITSTV